MKYKEIDQNNDNDLLLLEEKLRRELSDLSLQARMGQLAKTAKISALRKDIARVMTAKKDRLIKTKASAVEVRKEP